ncbi:hypothetical protein [Haliscomenobacter sp.]|uniref:hypothetical protein n=1 Tax=Haliscomenobacter sp. TaxID=2717303 RepID=UPI00359330A8
MRSSNTLLIFGGLCLTILVACSPDRSALNWLHKTERDWAKLENKQPEWPEMLDSEALQNRLDFLAESLGKTQNWVQKPLDAAVKTKLTALVTDLEAAQSHLETQQSDPSSYNLGLRLRSLFAPDQPFEMKKLEDLENYLDQASVYYRQAKQKLQAPAPNQCDSAVAQHIISITYLREELGAKIAESNLPNLKIKQLNQKISRSCLYMKDYLAWCRSMAFEARN